MTDAPHAARARWVATHRSVFAKLVAIMVTMAVCLLLLVGGFFGVIVGPSLTAFVEPLVDEYTRAVVAAGLDRATATRVGARIGMQVRYEGPAGAWTTSPRLPPLPAPNAPNTPDVPRPAHAPELLPRWDYSVVSAPDGGRYLFAWTFGDRMRAVHVSLHVLLLVLLVGVVVTTHAVIRRLLRPLRVLSDGVARLGDGQLDVRLPRATADEFGTLTDAFNAMVGRVRAMIGARDQLLVDVSHELRSPITRMKVTLELMPDGANRTRLTEDVGEMERMVAELLELERLRDGRGLRPSHQDVVPILREIAERYRDTGPGVRIAATPDAVWLDVDGEQLRTVLRNLVENAAKHAHPDSAPIVLTAAPRPDAVEIRVTDDGVGIPDADVERLFEPFFRVDRSRSKRTGGYGLGLSICKRVMEAHGGTITVDRSVRRGASFVLLFPTRRSVVGPATAGNGSAD